MILGPKKYESSRLKTGCQEEKEEEFKIEEKEEFELVSIYKKGHFLVCEKVYLIL